MSSKEPEYDLLGDKPKKKIQIKRKPKKPPLPPGLKGIRRNPKSGKLTQSTLTNPTYGMLTPSKPKRAAPKPKKVIQIKREPKKKVIQIKREPKKKVIKIKRDGMVKDPNTGRLRKKEIVGKKVRGGVKNVDVSKGKVLSKAPMTEASRKKQLAAIAISLKNKAIEEGKIEGKIQKKKVIQIKREPKKKVIQIKREPKKKVIQIKREPKKKVIQIKRDKPPPKPPLPPYAKDLMRDASGKLVKKNIKAKIQKAKEAEKKAAQEVNTLKDKIKKARAEEKKAKTEAKKNTLKEKIKKAKQEEKKAKVVQKEVKKAAKIIKAAPAVEPKKVKEVKKTKEEPITAGEKTIIDSLPFETLSNIKDHLRVMADLGFTRVEKAYVDELKRRGGKVNAKIQKLYNDYISKN